MRKMSLVISLLSICSTTFASDMTGDTVGAALGNLSAVNSSLARLIEPGRELGPRVGRITLEKHACAALGSAAGAAFAVSRTVRFYTPKYSDTSNRQSTPYVVATEINKLIDLIVDSSNEFCNGHSRNLDKVVSNAKVAIEVSNNLTNLLKAAEQR